MIGETQDREDQGLSVIGISKIMLRMPSARRARGIAPWLYAGSLLLVASQSGQAQTSITYSYNGSNRVIQAISSTGVGVQYQYDPAGNVLGVSAISAEALTNGTPDTLTFSTPGEAELLVFTLATEQNVSLSDSSLALSGNGASLMFNVYNAAGSLVGSYNSSTGSDLIVSGLAAGAYSVVVIPSSGTTGSVQLSLNTSSAGTGGGDTDAPLPLWANLLLGTALVGLGGRAVRRRPVT